MHQSRGGATAPATPSRAYGQLPLSFEANVGQADTRVKFLSRGQGPTVFFTATEAVLAFGSFRTQQSASQIRRAASHTKDSTSSAFSLRLGLRRANPRPNVTGVDVLPGKSHYLIGNDPRAWHTGVSHYARVQYSGVYPGIDLVYYGNGHELEYDFLIAAGADPSRIQLEITGAKNLRIDASGDLLIQTARGEIRQEKPRVYQKVGAVTTLVPGRYELKAGGVIAFRLGHYDSTRPLVIDPVLHYSTYLGGSGTDGANGIAIDWNGNAFVTGETASLNFPTTSGAYQLSFLGGTYDGFVTKLLPDGSGLVYSSYLGGGENDAAFGIAVDGSNTAYVAGGTSSDDFPITFGVFQPIPGGGQNDAFVTRFNANGSGLTYSTYLGGIGVDRANGIALAGSNAYVTGWTESINFPTANALQPAPGGVRDGFVTALNASGSDALYSTYLGGTSTDAGLGIAVDGAGSAYVTGYTESTNFPTANAWQPSRAGVRDAFVTKLTTDGSALQYSTYLGGTGSENLVDDGTTIGAIGVDGSGTAHVTGSTRSTNFPILNSLQSIHGGGLDDVFVTRFNPAGTAVFSTYLGGGASEAGIGMAVHYFGTAYLTGRTSSANFPVSSAVQPISGGGADAFIAAVATVADLTLWKFDWPDPVASGATITYWVTVYNSGVDEASWAVLYDDVPLNTTFQSLDVPPGWACSTPAVGGTGTVICWIPVFEPAALATFTMGVRVNQPLSSGTVIWNLATIWSVGTQDPNSNDNWGLVTTTVSAGASSRP